MPLINRLRDIQVRQAKPKDKAYKLFDGGGLFLMVTKAGTRLWRYKYRYNGKENTYSIGRYPQISLQEARMRHLKVRQMLADGIDPNTNKRRQRFTSYTEQGNTFQVVAEDWFNRNKHQWTQSYAQSIMSKLKRDIYPDLANRPITEITTPELLESIRAIEARGAIEAAHRTLGICSQIFKFAIATGKSVNNPALHLQGALIPVQRRHLAAITDPKRVGQLLRMIDAYEGSMIIKSALKLAPLVFVRPGELRTARWDDIDWQASEWRFLVTKTNTDHVVPLATQAIDVLKTIHLLTHRSEYVFPSARSFLRPLSNNGVLVALRAMGITKEEMSGHGFRAMARTLIAEQLNYRAELLEHQLAHTVRDPLGRAYNRTQFLKERREMMQRWANYLDELRNTTI